MEHGWRLGCHCRRNLTDKAKITIVFADDHPIFRDGLRRVLLENDSLQLVGEATDGESAVHVAVEKKPALMLLDFSLPGFSGIEVLRRLREAGSQTKVLLLTAGMNRMQTLAALELGARGVLTKDAAAELLSKAIRCVVAGEYWIGRDIVADWLDFSRHQTAPKHTLTVREREVINQALAGKTNHEIANTLGISDETVKRHIRNIYDKCGVSNRMELALYVAGGNLPVA